MSGGGSAGKTKSESTTVDPWLTKINQLAYEQTKAGISKTGGLSAALEHNPYADLTDAEKALYARAQAGPGENEGMTGYEREGMELLRDSANPEMALKKASDLFGTYSAPFLQNQAIASGLGARSGAVLESQARGFADMTLPLLQQASGNAQAFQRAAMSNANNLRGRFSEDINRSLMAAAAPRLAAGAEYMRPHNIMTSLIGGLPYGGGTVTQVGQTKAYRGDTDWLMDVIMPMALTTISAAGSAAGGMAGCWVADALFGALSDKARYARYWLMVAWRGEAADTFREWYLNNGEGLATDQDFLTLARPVFERAAYLGALALEVA